MNTSSQLTVAPSTSLCQRTMQGRRDIWLEERKPVLCPYVTVSQSASRLSTYARMSPMNNLPSFEALFLWSENATIDQWLTRPSNSHVQVVFPLTSFQLFDCFFKPPSNCIDTSSSCVIKDRRLITRSIAMCNFAVCPNHRNVIEDFSMMSLKEREILDSLTSPSGKGVTEEN